ncbi:MAG: hypothetical protein H7Y20_09865 [Bryobacteraceae bacterium]|nr:hypothetical protein [Bryobacteraceae bacterium]
MTHTSFRNALEDILDVPKSSLRDSDSRETIENWTSVADVQILTIISGELGVEPDAALIEAETVGELVSILDAGLR